MSDEVVCPDCETNNVVSWVYENEITEKKFVIRCRECGETFEEPIA